MTLSRKTPLTRKTPLNRGTSELKRSPFANRSGSLPRRRGEPRKHADDWRRGNSKPLSNAAMYESYRERFGGCCEVSYWGGIVIEDGQLHRVRVGNLIDKRLERHHLWSINRRPDFRSNLLITTKVFHDWAHGHHPKARTIGVCCKLRKLAAIGEPEEFTLAEIDRAAAKHVAGVIECYCFIDELMRGFQAEAVRGLKRLAG